MIGVVAMGYGVGMQLSQRLVVLKVQNLIICYRLFYP